MVATRNVATAMVGATGSVAGATIVSSPGSSGEVDLADSELISSEEEVIEEENPLENAFTRYYYHIPEVPVKNLNPLLLSNWRYSPGGHYDTEEGYFGEDSAISNVASFDLENSTELTRANSNSAYVDSFFDPYKSGDYKDTRSSLRVHTTKRQFFNGKGTGATTWFGSFRKGNKGFGTVNTAGASPSNRKELILTGGFYLVELDEQTNMWNIKYHKEIKEQDQKFIDLFNIKLYFPKPHWYTQAGGFDKLYYTNGNLMKSLDELDTKCGANDCDNWASTTTNSAGKWEGKGEGGFDRNCNSIIGKKYCDKVWGWSGDYQDASELQWWDYMYGETGLKLRNKLAVYYKGAWEMPYLKSWVDKYARFRD